MSYSFMRIFLQIGGVYRHLKTSIKDSDILKFAIENGMLDIGSIQETILRNKRSEVLKKYNIWQAKDGTWKVWLPDKEKKRVQKCRKSQKAIEDLVIEFDKEHSAKKPTIQDAFTSWNDHKRDYKKICDATYDRNRQIFNRHYKGIEETPIEETTAGFFIEFLEREVAEKEIQSKAFSNLRSITRGFLRHARRNGLISYSVDEIFEELDISKNDFKKVYHEDINEVFSDEEMDKMIGYLVQNIDAHNAGILLMFVTGMRVGELCALRNSDIGGNFISIRRTETRHRNSEGEYVYEVGEQAKTPAGMRNVVIPESFSWILDYLKTLNPNGEYVFANSKGKRMTTNCFRQRLYGICDKLGVVKKSPHKIRKTFGSILLDNNIDRNLVIELMGHTSIGCTERHYHRNRKSIDKKAEIISAIPEFQLAK